MEYKNEKLVVDEAVFDPHTTSYFLVRVGEEWFRAIGRGQIAGTAPSKLSPHAGYVCPEWARMVSSWEFHMFGLIPRNGYTVDIGNPMNSQDFDALCKRLKLADDDISGHFDDIRGAVFGKEFEKHFTSVQIKVPDAIGLEQELRDLGIEAANVAPGRLNIRVGN